MRLNPDNHVRIAEQLFYQLLHGRLTKLLLPTEYENWKEFTRVYGVDAGTMRMKSLFEDRLGMPVDKLFVELRQQAEDLAGKLIVKSNAEPIAEKSKSKKNIASSWSKKFAKVAEPLFRSTSALRFVDQVICHYYSHKELIEWNMKIQGEGLGGFIKDLETRSGQTIKMLAEENAMSTASEIELALRIAADDINHIDKRALELN